MTKKIDLDQFRALLEDIDVSDEEIASFLVRQPGGPSGFNPTFTPDPDLVAATTDDRAESAITVGNAWCRWRRRQRFKRRVAKGDTAPVIVSEGDSWFQFPFIIKDVIDHLEDDYLVWSCGAAGDTAQNMVFENPEYMQALDDQAERVGAFLFSAAGNDVIGEDKNGDPVLPQLLHKRTTSRASASDLVNKAALRRVTNFLGEAYRKVIRTVRSDPRFAGLPILIHGYDFAIPFPGRNNDPRDPYWAADNQWLGKPLDDKEIRDPKLRREIVEYLINELYQLLEDVVAEDENVHLVNVRRTLTHIGDWADEIHGTSDGFAKVANKFRNVLKRVVQLREPEVYYTAETASDQVTPIEGPDLLLNTHHVEKLPPETMGFGDTETFASGFRRISRPEIAIGEDDSAPFRFLTAGAERGKAVCKIVASGRDFRGRFSPGWSGSGFLVAPNILLTNFHVLNSVDVASNARAIFNYQDGDAGTAGSTATFKLNPDRLYLDSSFEELDYCFVWVEGAPQDQFGFIEFWRGSFIGAPGSAANIIHHPNGDPKRVSYKKNPIVPLGMDEVLVHYAADTEPGSSGSPVMSDEWRLFALHHASTGDLTPTMTRLLREQNVQGDRLNEGVKTSAIAIDVEKKANHGPNQSKAREVLGFIRGTDSRVGFFGALGRPASRGNDLEVVVNTYRGAPDDVDIAFWNIEWFNRTFRTKVNDVARIVADLNLDIWALEESSPEATGALVRMMRDEFDLDFHYAASEPDASSGKQTTTIMWNAKTVSGERVEWPDEVDELLRLSSDDPEADRFEAVEGKIFNRYPGLFNFVAARPGRAGGAFAFSVVPVHLKARGEGAKRRRMASKILAEAVRVAQESGVIGSDVLLGGDYNAELSTNQFRGLSDAGFIPLSAEDERGGAITYLGRRHRSLIDTIFVSPGMRGRAGADDFIIVAPDREDSGFIDRVSDHRPVIARLSLAEAPGGGGGGRTPPPVALGDDEWDGDRNFLRKLLEEMSEDPSGVLSEIADLIRQERMRS